MELFDILEFHSAEAENVSITTTEPAWTDLLDLVVDVPAGTYGVVSSIQFQVGSTRSSFIYQYSLDGGATWGEAYAKEVKDRQNIEVTEILTVVHHPGGLIDFRCRVTRESDFTCDVLKALLTIERKG